MSKNSKALLGIIIIFSTSLLIMLLSGLLLNHKKSYDYIFLGDSIFGNVRDDTSIPALVADMKGVSYINGGLGGTTASVKDKTFSEAAEYSASLYNIARAAAYDDFSCVLASQPVRFDGDLTYFQDAVKALSEADFEKAEVIIIEHGLNDYFADVPVINEENMEDTSTYYGALTGAVNCLKTKNPQARIILVTPVSADEEVREYADAMLLAGLTTGIEVLDMYSMGVVTKDNIDIITVDGIHLSEEGRRQYARILAEYINE